MQEGTKKVLVVDDETEICDLVATHIKEMTNYTVLTAHGGREAFDILQEKRVDVVISDIRMPHGDGMKLLEKINTLKEDRPRVIIISGTPGKTAENMEDSTGTNNSLIKFLSTEIMEDDVKAKGGDVYLSKPLDYQNLIKLLTVILESSKK